MNHLSDPWIDQTNRKSLPQLIELPLAQPCPPDTSSQATDPLSSHHKMPSSNPPSATVHGLDVTPTTQCTHWHSPLDIIAVKHFCCDSCHDTCETHKSGVWPREQRAKKAVLCGACKHVLSIEEYMTSGSKCTQCGNGFNPGCKGHWGMYFEMP
jgi:uncharacterized CHY-type Zn-finger protein